MHQHLPTVDMSDPMTLLRAEEDAEEEAYQADRAAEIAGKKRGLAYAKTCLDCRHLPPDYLDVGPDPFSRMLREDRRLGRLAVHAREGCDTCPYLPENYGKPVRARVLGLDDWGDGPDEDLIRRARFDAWEAQHESR
ncbi:hypothetical protein ACNI65_05535 [Roseateles sp. So40a]|uniref:hypothetical protein n=1 Tax=Roseateles sp. So40a TaxID=3400226 RepID=UPI003A8A7AFB